MIITFRAGMPKDSVSTDWSVWVIGDDLNAIITCAIVLLIG